MGWLWIPLAVGIQFFFLYAILGGPGALLARVTGHEQIADGVDWGRLQVGLPVALVLAFPSLMILAILDKWVRQVGLLEITVVQTFSLICLLLWLRGTGSVGAKEEGTQTEGDQAEGEGAYARAPCFQQVPQPVESTQPIEAIPAPVVIPPPPVAPVSDPVKPTEILRRKLGKIYLWDDVGLGFPWAEARRLPPGQLLSREDVIALGTENFAALRRIARDTLGALRRGEDLPRYRCDMAEAIPDPWEYQLDVLQRLVCSVFFQHERLYVDQTDVELCGQRRLLLLYRIALSTVLADELPPSGQPVASASGRLH